MSASTVTREMVPEIPAESLTARARRGFVMAGWAALLIGMALGFVQANPNVVLSRLPFAVTAAVVMLVVTALLGLLCGAIIGLWLWGSTGALRFMVSFVTILIGVLSMEMMRGFLLKMSLREALTSYSDLLEGAQLLVGALGAAIGIRTGQASPERMAEVTSGSERRFTLRLPWRPRRTASQEAVAEPPRPARQRRQRRRSGRGTGARTQRATQATSARPAAPPSAPPPVQVSRPAPAQKPLRSKRRKPGRGRKVHLGRQVSTVCPYCLEEVLPNDPRGRVVCRICHTPHHGDCWAISGKCEVPHLQT